MEKCTNSMQKFFFLSNECNEIVEKTTPEPYKWQTKVKPSCQSSSSQVFQLTRNSWSVARVKAV